jgi:hypothetical protein
MLIHFLMLTKQSYHGGGAFQSLSDDIQGRLQDVWNASPSRRLVAHSEKGAKNAE